MYKCYQRVIHIQSGRVQNISIVTVLKCHHKSTACLFQMDPVPSHSTTYSHFLYNVVHPTHPRYVSHPVSSCYNCFPPVTPLPKHHVLQSPVLSLVALQYHCWTMKIWFQFPLMSDFLEQPTVLTLAGHKSCQSQLSEQSTYQTN